MSALDGILLQKSNVASVRIFGDTLKREAIDDSDNPAAALFTGGSAPRTRLKRAVCARTLFGHRHDRPEADSWM
jgi:hypothetical protein